jgi:phosphatidylserine/phosphatidylglycerophosphate/cardiolipin synthase-like enzyme
MSTHANNTASTDIFKFYTDHEYRAELCGSIRKTKAGDRVLLMSMTFEPTEPEIAAIMRELELAAARGVHVSLAVDAHSFLFHPAHIPGPLWSRTSLPKHMLRYHQNKLRILETLDAYPTGHADIINLPLRKLDLPVAGRSHIKAAIVNDRIFLGSCNLEWGKRVDLMVGWCDADVSTRLYDTFINVIHNKHAGRGLSGVDRGIDISDGAKVYIDSGVRGQSLIFDEALRLIDSAEEWLVITCQFFPNSVTAKHLVLAARRGVKVEVIYTHPKHHGIIGGFGQQVSILRERTRVPKSLFQHALSRKDPLLHAKLIATDKGVMIGSHNYVKAGVILGTAETALEISDENLAREAVKTLHRSLTQKSTT